MTSAQHIRRPRLTRKTLFTLGLPTVVFIAIAIATELLLRSVSAHDSELASTWIVRSIGWGLAIVLSLFILFTLRSHRRQQRMYAALAESQNRFLRAFNTAPQGMALVDQNGKWISVNATFCQILGHSEKSLLATQPHIISPRLSPENMKAQWELSQQANTLFELKLRNARGHGIVCLVSLALVESEQAEKSYWIVQVVDISRRVEAEITLKESAEYTQAVLDNIKDGIITATEEGVILSANPAVHTIWKHANNDYRKRSFFELLEDDQAEEIKEKLIAFEADHSHSAAWLTHECIINDGSDTAIAIEINIAVTERKGETQLLILLRDISERKRLEALKEEFVAIVSHELRTPLTAIIGSLKLIEGGVFGTLAPPLAKLIHVAAQNGQQLAMIINDILDMNKLAAGKMDFEFSDEALMPQIDQAFDNNRNYATQFNVSYQISNQPPDCRIRVDTHRLQQIMSNLLSNAAKFSPANSTVAINLIQSETNVRIEVQDTGAGISEYNQTKLFKKFSQVDGSATRLKGGTGLGLSICKELVERMGGEIGCNSVVGKGTTFYFTVPLVVDGN
jgi:PAS domain S-box-containing protein